MLDRGVEVGLPIENAREGYREIRLHDPDGTAVTLFSWTDPGARAAVQPVRRNENPRRVDNAKSDGARASGPGWFIAIAIGPGPARAQKPAPVQDVSTFPHRTPAEEQKALHVPPGFEIQLVAAEPDIQKPLNLAFDDRGRLWVTDTVEYPYPGAGRNQAARHREDPRGLRPRRQGSHRSRRSPTA